MEAFQSLCARENLLPENGVVLCALSGGADSVCLLHLLHERGKHQGFTVAAAHFNHQIRPEAGEDAAFCSDFCRQWKIPFYTRSEDISAYAARKGLTLEEAARERRYAFLRETAEEIHAAAIATAHNAEDNAETVLLHLLRGTGLKGMGGIAAKSGALIRPLLTTRRSEIEAYLAVHRLPHVEDATNQDTYYTRNYIRHEVLPLLLARNPGIVEGLGRSAVSFRRDNDYLEQQASGLAAKAVCTGEEVSILAKVLGQAPEALSFRAVQQLVTRLAPETVLSAAHRQAVLALCRSENPSGHADLPEGLVAWRRYDRLVFGRKNLLEPDAPVELPLPGRVNWRGWEIQAEEALCPEGKFNQPEDFYLKAKTPVLLRSRKAGDEITLPSRPRKSVKKLLIEQRVPKNERDCLPVFEAEGALIALGRFGADCGALPRVGERCWHIICRNRKEKNTKCK